MRRLLQYSIVGLVVLTAAVVVGNWLGLMKSNDAEYVEYRPVVHNLNHGDHLLADAPELLTPDHVEAVQRVLQRYGEPFKLEGGKLYIRHELSVDRDLLANYTEKAEDMRKSR